MGCFCVCFTAAEGTEEVLWSEQRRGLEIWAGLCPSQLTGDPPERCEMWLWHTGCSCAVIHSVRNSLGKEKSVQSKFGNEVIQNQTSLKDVLLLCWNPVMIRFGFRPGYWNNWAVGVSLEWVFLTGTVWGVIKGRADKGDGSQVTLVEICLH